MTVRWRRGFKRVSIALTALWLLPYTVMAVVALFEKGAGISDPGRFWTFLLGPILLVWTVYFVGVWLANGFLATDEDHK